MVTGNMKRKQETSEAAQSSDNSMDVEEALSDKEGKVAELKRLLDTPDYAITAGEKWYIISSKYLAQLKQHIDEGGSNQTTNPGAVNNKDLIAKSDEQNVLKDDLVETVDYEFVSEDTWSRIVNMFGVADDAQTIEVHTYQSPSMEIKIEARPLAFQCALYPGVKDFRTIRASRSMSIKECTEALLVKFNVSKSKICRFWICLPGEKPYLPNLENEQAKLNELDLSPKHQIIVETKDEASTWALNDDEALEKLQTELQSLLDGPASNFGIRTGGETKGNRYNLRSAQTGTQDGNGSSNGWNGQSNDFTPGLIGLGNLGNTCFMNSSLQCLSNIPELTEYFMTKSFMRDVNEENPLGKQGVIANGYAHLIDSLWNKSSGSVYPTDFKKTLSRYTSLFNGAQQDAQESLQYIVDCLHEDLNRVRKKPYFADDENDQKDDVTASAEAWGKYMARNNSVIVDLFHGQIRSTIQCPDCKKLSVTFDPVCYYSLPLPSKNTKKISFVFVPYGSANPISRHRLTVLGNVDIEELLTNIGKQIAIQPEYLLPVVLYDNRVEKILKRIRSVEELQERDKIFIYQLAYPIGDDSHVPAICYLRKSNSKDESFHSTNSGTVFDFPFVLSLSTHGDGISARVLYALVYSKLKGRLRLPDGESSLSDDGVVGDGMQQGDENDLPVEQLERSLGPEWNDDEAKLSDTPYALFVPNIFTVGTINLNANVENSRIKRDQKEPVVLPAKNDIFLSVNLTEENVKKYYSMQDVPTDDDRVVRPERNAADTVELRDCFQLYISPERLSGTNLWRCPVCKEEKPAMKKLDLWQMPKYMFVHLKRFQYNRFYREKLSTKVRFPLKGLDLTDLVVNHNREQPAVYDLVTVSCHSGGLGGGHYWAMCKNVKDANWYKFDDSTVRPATEGDVMNETTPYILIYKRQDADVGRSSTSTSPVPKEEFMDTA